MAVYREEDPTVDAATQLPEILDTQDIAEDLGVKLETVQEYLKRARRHRRAGHPLPGDLVEPDAPPRGRRPRWKRGTYLAWKAGRPGRGIGGGRPRKDRGTGDGRPPMPAAGAAAKPE